MEAKWDKNEESFIVKEKIDNQTFFMEFQLYDESDDTVYFNICMGIYNKRKHAGSNEDNCLSTGKNPFKTIAYAVQAFNLLEEKIQNGYRGKKVHVSCWWTDNRRREVYSKFLFKKGYQYGNLYGKKILFKIYN